MQNLEQSSLRNLFFFSEPFVFLLRFALHILWLDSKRNKCHGSKGSSDDDDDEENGV